MLCFYNEEHGDKNKPGGIWKKEGQPIQLIFLLVLFCLDSQLTMLIVPHIDISTEVMFNHASICEI